MPQQVEDEADYGRRLSNTETRTGRSWTGTYTSSLSANPTLSGCHGLAATPYVGNPVLPSAPYAAQPPLDDSSLDASYGGSTGPFSLPIDATLPDAPPPRPDLAPVAIDPSWPFDISFALDLLECRPNPQFDLGAANLLRPLVVTDAWDPLDRVIFVSDSFLALTGYGREEFLGSNCRFLQSPDGLVSPGAPRRSIRSASAYLLKQKVGERRETGHSIINFKKSGEAFMNHLALVPIPWGPVTAAPRFILGFANVFDDSALLTAQRQSGLDAPSCFFQGQIPGVAASAPGWSGLSIPSLAQINGDSIAKGFEVAQEDFVNGPKSDDDGSGTESLTLDYCLEEPQNDDTSLTTSWQTTLLQNVDALVQVVSLEGTIAYASDSHKTLGYRSSDLVGKSINGLYHPSDVAVLTKELRSLATDDLDLTIRDGDGRCWATLTLLQHPIISLGSQALWIDRSSGQHDIWMKLATSGLVLHLFDNPQKALGLTTEDLVGIRLQELLPQSEARADFESILATACQGEVASSTLALTSGRGHRLEANVVLHPGPRGGSRRPYYLLACCGIVRPYAKRRKEPPPGNKKYDTTATAAPPAQSLEDGGDDDILEDLNPNRCGPLGYEIYQLDGANQSLRAEMQELLKHASQRRRAKKHGEDPGGCANCHTKVSPEWRRGPGGERNLCNRCGLRWAKTRRDAEEAASLS
ncbi:hypothetical protein PG988_013711 [Apiospora saccharicola]